MLCTEFSLKIEEEYDNDPGEYGGSKPSRKCTDIPGTILMILNIMAIIAIQFFYIKHADLDVLLKGFDKNGNICGRHNIKTNSTSAFKNFGVNMEQKKYLFTMITLYGDTNSYELTQECVEDCSKIPGAKLYFLNRCYLEGFLVSYLNMELILHWKYILSVLGLSIIISVIMLLLYIYYTNFIVKFSILYFGIALIDSAIYCLINRINIKEFDAYISSSYFTEELFLVLSVAIFIFTILLLKFSNYMKFKIKLSVLIFQEAGKSLAAMPLLLFLPLITSLLEILYVFIVFYNYVLTISYSYLDVYYDLNARLEMVYYAPVTLAPFIFTVFGIWWVMMSTHSLQYMIVCSCVAQWFYTRNKTHLYKPIKSNIVKVLKYHIGTISTGTLLLTVIQFMQQILGFFKATGSKKESIVSCVCNFMAETWLNSTVAYLNFYTHNGFIMTAIYGYAFCKGSIRAVKVLCHNIFNVIVINKMGDFILLSAKLAVTLTLGLICGIICSLDNHILHKTVFIFMTGTFSYCIVHVYFSVFEAAIDTIFLCFCEDCKYNNGTSKPYYMSPNLVEYVENANKLEHPIKWKISAEYWEKGPKRILQV